MTVDATSTAPAASFNRNRIYLCGSATHALGCTQIVSQTLTMLRDPFANLQRAGFREIYEEEVYESPR